jgi:16S rRNA (cytidine1402-2'-O)-methyltransferase
MRVDVNNLEPFSEEPKGEFTIVISGVKIDKKYSQELSESVKTNIKKMINKFSVKEIISIINQGNDISKKEIYNYCLKIKNEN